VRRRIAASADRVFDAWLDAKGLAAWMRPNGITHTTATLDARVGGGFEIVMYAADGPIRHTGTYRLIDRPRRLVFTWHSPGTWQRETLVTVEFRAAQGSTEVVVTHEQLPDQDALRSHTAGWSNALERLAAEFDGAV
jgi:uncharacterized protein YndB with AHSA1/START domain